MTSLLLDTLKPRFFRWSSDSVVWGRVLRLNPGFHVIHAPSGRGKSTLLKAVAGFGAKALEGRVSQEGSSHEPLIWEAPSYLDQGLSSVRSLSQYENLQLGLRSSQVLTERSQDLAQKLGLDVSDPRPCASLSRGELQRLLFMIAVLRSSSWLVLDEPTAHLDPDTARLVWDILASERATGRGVLISSLDPVQEGILSRDDLNPIVWSI